jgi:hypothetical protein
MPLALASSVLIFLKSPSAARELVTVSTHLAHREQRMTSTRGWAWSME